MSEKKYTYDEIIASAYYVFRQELNPNVIINFLIYMKNLGYIYHREDLRFKELDRFFIFDGANFCLKEGAKLEDIAPFIQDNLTWLFSEMKSIRNEYYEDLTNDSKTKKIGSKNYEG